MIFDLLEAYKQKPGILDKIIILFFFLFCTYLIEWFFQLLFPVSMQTELRIPSALKDAM